MEQGLSSSVTIYAHTRLPASPSPYVALASTAIRLLSMERNFDPASQLAPPKF